MSSRIPRVTKVGSCLLLAHVCLSGCGSDPHAGTDVASTSALASAVAPVVAPAETRVVLQTSPRASCFLSQKTAAGTPPDTRKHMRILADDQGIVRLTLNGSVDAMEKLDLSLDCHDGAGATMASQALTRAAMVLEPGPQGTVLPALAGDPMALTARQLKDRGYPRRPDPILQPDEFKSWQSLVSAPSTSVGAHAVEIPDHFNGTFNTSNWSGYGIAQPSTQYGVVAGHFTVPSACYTYPSFIGDYMYMSTWAGIDGGPHTSTDVVQAGAETDCEVYQTTSAPYTLYAIQYTYAWVEWYPNPEHDLSNFPVWPGDNFYVTVALQTDDDVSSFDPNKMTFYLVDYTRSTSSYGCIGPSGCVATPPSGHTTLGDTAEWIVERPGWGNPQTWPFDFPDYNTAQIWGAYATEASSGIPHTVTTDATDKFNLQDSGTGHTLSTATTTGSTSSAGVINFTRTRTTPMNYK